MGFSFNNLPINPLVGADRNTFRRVTEGRTIDSHSRYRLTRGCRQLLDPLYALNDHSAEQLADMEIVAPVFILGHWRSGTTYLHNLLCQDPQFGYCTTYQTVFPHLMLHGNRLFKALAALCMPSHRPTDNVKLGIDLPQEEEFAIANMTHAAFYHFWIFPQQIAVYRDKYLLLNCSEQERTEFCNATRRTMQIALHCQRRSRFLSKNPPHTARIATLLEMFPDAKFIYISRDRDSVLNSTKKFFRSMLSAISLQDIEDNELNNHIEITYHALLDSYRENSVLIPPQNLYQLHFEELVANPNLCLQNIYKNLKL